MNVHFFRTNEKYFMKEMRLFFNSEKNDWIQTVEFEENAANENFCGFGVALTGSSCYELYTMPQDKREKFLDEIYGEEGLGLSVARISIASSDYSTSLYSYCDTPGDTVLKTFSIEKDREFIIPMIKEVIEHNRDIQFLASPWSPPGWMKAGGSIAYGYMRDCYIDCYADYTVKFIKEYEKNGIKISAVTPQNEPETHQYGKSVACVWTPDTEAKYMLKLREKLDEANLDTKIWMYDHSFIAWPRILWTLKEYPKLISCIDAVAFHYYDGSVELVDNIKAEYPDLKWCFTEGGPRLYDNYETDWIKWAIMIARALAHGAESFFGWNLLLDEDGGPNIGPFGCGGLATLDSQSGELTYSGQYHAFKHFSKFIKRGSVIHRGKLSEDFSGMFTFPNGQEIPVDIISADNPDGSHAVVLVNPNSGKRQAQYFYDNKWWYIEMMPKSVTTLYFEK